ncbi:putative cyclic nucleotide-gated ion channel 9 [Lolium rigidum]|uniref:putative cyclic nucleotide-gated ion channel 9 n=1 Tax=Lolium rigidum TaxID=89674 RepID=UPI001F5D753C|nr:putative cyclic nucleotide-gated ion channel 9 [Lolium rigidum]
MSYEASTAGIGGGERRRSAFHIGYGGVVGASRRRLAQPEALARGVITTGSAQLRTLGRSIRTGAAMAAVFQEDLKTTSKKIFDPQDRLLVRLNRSFLISCILSIAIDPMFFYGPVVTLDDNKNNMCIGIERSLAISTAVLRTVVDLFFLARIVLQFRTAFIAPSSRVFGRGELVIDTVEIAKRYFRRFFVADVLSILPLPQVVIWRFLFSNSKTAVLETKDNLLFIIITQYVPRLVRIYPLSTELKRTSGVFAETALAGAAYYLLWYMLASHIVGAFWYLLSIERVSDCWRANCDEFPGCNTIYMYCGSTEESNDEFKEWTTVIKQVIYENCEPDGQNPFDYGIYSSAVTSEVIRSKDMTTKLLFCLWFGLANLSTLGQGLKTTIYTGESLFAISLATFGLILMAMLIGNIQTYLQSLTVRLEEMRVKRRDSEQWMHHRLLPQELRERVRRYDQYKWVNTRGVDEEALVQNLPKDLRRDIKRHLCLGLVRRVPLFDNMDERLLDAICERLKPALYTERTYIIREGDPVDQMVFIIRGSLESITTDGGRSGFFNRSMLQESDFCGEELLTWALDPKSGVSLPSSTRTVMALSEVEAFALHAEELKFVAGQFRRMHSKQVQHTFRFYSQQWRTWAATYIQAAWRRHLKRKAAELRRKEEEEEGRSSSFKTTILVSRFAAKMHRQRSKRDEEVMIHVPVPKPREPDFGIDD